jgi:hypothetical protein
MAGMARMEAEAARTATVILSFMSSSHFRPQGPFDFRSFFTKLGGSARHSNSADALRREICVRFQFSGHAQNHPFFALQGAADRTSVRHLCLFRLWLSFPWL